MSSVRNSLGFLNVHAGFAMNIRKYTPPTTNSFGATKLLTPFASGLFQISDGFCA